MSKIVKIKFKFPQWYDDNKYNYHKDELKYNKSHDKGIFYHGYGYVYQREWHVDNSNAYGINDHLNMVKY